MSQARFELSDAAFRLIVENSEDIMAICDADGSILYTNPSSFRVLGYKEEEVVGSTGFDLLHPEDRANAIASLNEFVKTPGARDSMQYRTRHANGEWVPLEVLAHNMLDDPVIHGVVLNVRDVSQRNDSESKQDPSLCGLNDVMPICSSCKKIRDKAGKWEEIEMYVRKCAKVEFSHGICPDCATRLYPEHFKK